ncbi:HAD family hydrolase [Gemelliphila palaticanis]|uniref:HAD family phosphatase n=1 Tax=Gemelliphila palaticanis TaxID=81950 RepID=A0ABX2SYK4_9BACL|nr:HAD family hydrolase [Gemella palaticanis]MBF0715487.1 HAD family phosphatase [Gemella palaticanis]NYS47417.1 HAD family phosphatase [Gemella palaticanis]
MTKWFVTDMDGTFLNDKREISPRAKEVMQKLKEKNVKFFIATGRLDLAVRKYYNSMNLEDSVISCNGGFIRNLSNLDIVYEKSFTNDQIKIIYDTYKKLTDGSIQFHLYTSKYIYCDTLSLSLERIKKVEEDLDESLKTPMKIIPEGMLKEFLDSGEKCYKVMMLSKNHDILVKIFEETKKYFSSAGTFSATDFFDIMPYGTNKGSGIEKVAEYYDLDIKDSVVFGDNFNDVDMLKVAGTSICPSNARDEIKLLCDEVIGNNNDFSVLEYIEKYVDSI